MKDIIKYSFSILIMISCLILFTITAFKTIVFGDISGKDDKNEPAQQEHVEEAEENEKDDKPAEPEAVNPEDAPFTSAEASYLNDALFIGDSRTMGLKEYGQMEGAEFFADTGMSVYNVREKVINVPGAGDVNLEQLLSSKQYAKIYLMLGINELGYNRDNTVQKYKELVEYIRTKAPDSLLFIQANLHVSAARSDNDEIFNNNNISEFNSRISELIDNKKTFYIDANEIFDDENGNLGAEYTSDNTHVLGKYYVNWKDWILTKAIEN